MKRFSLILALALLGFVPAVPSLAADKPADEVKLTVDQLPAAVKATLTKEAKGGAIENVTKETENGKTTYEADVTIDGTEYEIVVGEDGAVVSKKVDSETGEHDEKDEDNDKKE